MQPTLNRSLPLGGGLVLLALAASLAAQTQATPRPARITQAIDNTQFVRLHGNTPLRARGGLDRGAAAPEMMLHRMLLLLKRSPEQEQALEQMISDQYTAGSPRFHQWLTPQQFGDQFGPSPVDVQTITSWLAGAGFTVTGLAPGGGVIEFSGPAGAVASALHTEIHQYLVNGEEHWANASDPAIPMALEPVVAGVVSLNNFVKPAGRMMGTGHGVKATNGEASPALTLDANNTQHAIVPGDFSVLYNAAPVYAAGINGTGETIAIVGRSDVDPNNIAAFRKLFVPAQANNLPTTIVNGPDPGDTGGGDEGEADLDLEWSGGVAPNAKIDFVVSATTETTDGVDLSAEYIITNNLAPIMSTSFAACEAGLGTSENQFINGLYEQAAAQGITVIDSSGDSGAAGCDPNDGSEQAATQGLAVSGLASTPFSVGVGGTQFNEGTNNNATFWNATNDATDFHSAKVPIPETVWNESLTTNPASTGGPFSASGGGKSAVYAKPVWQSTAITGMPNDSVRDVPDLSFAAAGHDGYVVCDSASPCTVDPVTKKFSFDVFGGTSASAPSFAGVMALVEQKVGAIQGQANFTLYHMAKAETYSACNSANSPAANCVFLDTTVGDNKVPCAGASPNCSSTTSGTPGTMGFSATPGYDLATGLGSINIANLVNGWAAADAGLLASKTVLSLSPTTLTHGQAANIMMVVTQPSGAIGPTGDVALIAQTTSGVGNGIGVDAFTINTQGPACQTSSGCSTGSEQGLPGGTYTVVANYAGDASFAASVSNPISVTVAPEASVTTVGAFAINSSNQEVAITTAPYGTPLFVDGFVQGAAQNSSGTVNDGVAVGTVTFTNNGAPLSIPGQTTNVLALNSEAEASFPNGVTTLPPANYSLVGTYTPSPTDPNGAASFKPSTSAAAAFTITKAPTTTTIITNTVAGTTVTLKASITSQSFGNPPTGTVSFFSGTTQLGSAVGVTTDAKTGLTTAATVVTAPVGQDSVTAQYSGDANYAPSTSAAVVVTVGATGGGFTMSVSTATETVAHGASASFPLTLTPNNGFTGTVALSCSGLAPGEACSFAPASVALSGTASGSSTMTVTTTGVAAAPLLPAGPASRWPPAEWFALLIGLLGMVWLAMTKQRMRPRLLVAAIAFVALAAAGCGGGGGSNSGGNTPPPVNATITITGTSGSVTASQTVTLTVF
ncbi:MAG TPA: Ig-like domain repeat protein [Terriglobales bacterium]